MGPRRGKLPPCGHLPADNRGAPVAPGGTIKNDRNDAEAVATAARQGNMRFVGVKSEDQQARLSWHRVREGYKKNGLAVMNRIRGLLAEWGRAGQATQLVTLSIVRARRSPYSCATEFSIARCTSASTTESTMFLSLLISSAIRGISSAGGMLVP